MAFIPPTFNTRANFWSSANWQSAWQSGTGSVPDPDDTFDAQLRAPGFRAPITIGTPGLLPMELLLPQGTAVANPIWDSNEYVFWCDRVEVPAGTGRYYFIVGVDDVAKDFDNEYRLAFLISTAFYEGTVWNGGAHWPYAPPWPRPYP